MKPSACKLKVSPENKELLAMGQNGKLDWCVQP